MTDTAIRLLAAETAEAAERTFTVDGPLKSLVFEAFGKEWIVSESVVSQWIIIVVLGILFFILGRNLKVKPDS